MSSDTNETSTVQNLPGNEKVTGTEEEKKAASEPQSRMSTIPGKSMDSLAKTSPELLHAIETGIANQVISQMRKHQERIKELMREQQRKDQENAMS